MVRQVISLFAASTLALAAVGFGGLRAHAQDVPRITIPPMSQDAIDRFRDSLKNNASFVPHSPHASQQVESHIEGLWAGSKTEVYTNIAEVFLRFRPSTEELLARSITTENATSALLEYVDLNISYRDQSVEFVHSNPQDGREVGGFKAKVQKRDHPTRVKMVMGQRNSSMYVAVPPYHEPSELWGVFVCPRTLRYESVGRTGTRVLYAEPSPYNLSEVKVSAEANAEATYEAARGRVRGAVTLQLTNDMPESLTSRDVSISSIAEPRVSYRPKFPFDFMRFAPNSDVQHGVNMVVELQNRAGRIRRHNFSHVVSVHKSTEPSPVSVVINGATPTRDSGDCYIVQIQKYSWKEYDQGEVAF